MLQVFPFVFSQLLILLSVTSMNRRAKLRISSMLKRRGDCSVLCDNLVDWNNRRLKCALSSSEQNCCSFLYSPSAVLPIWYDHKQAWMCFGVIFLQELFAGVCTLVRFGTPNCSNYPLFCSPSHPTLLFNKFAFHQSETTVSKCQIWGRLSIAFSIIYTLSFNSLSYIRNFIGLLELCALLPPVIFFYCNLIQNRQNTPSFGSWIISRVFLIYILPYYTVFLCFSYHLLMYATEERGFWLLLHTA